MKSALDHDRRAGLGRHGEDTEAPVTLEGAGLINVDKAAIRWSSPSRVALVRRPEREPRGQKSELVVVSDAGGGAGTWQVELAPQAATAGATIEVPGSIDASARAGPRRTGRRDRRAEARRRARTTASSSCGGGETWRIPYLFLVTRPGFEGVGASKLGLAARGHPPGPSGRTSTLPQRALRPPPGYAEPADERGRARALYTTLVKTADRQPGVAVIQRDPRNSLIDPCSSGRPTRTTSRATPGHRSTSTPSCSTTTPISASPAPPSRASSASGSRSTRAPTPSPASSSRASTCSRCGRTTSRRRPCG